jgi:hypothetical protein
MVRRHGRGRTISRDRRMSYLFAFVLCTVYDRPRNLPHFVIALLRGAPCADFSLFTCGLQVRCGECGEHEV